MSLSKVLYFILPLFFLVAVTGLPAQQINSRHFDTSYGLPQVQVNALVKDNQGYLWFGTFAGLCRFDGTRMEIFTVEDGLPANHITGVLVTDDGSLAALTPFGFALINGDKILSVTRDNNDVLTGRLNGFCHANGSLFIAGTDGLFEYTDSKLVKIKTAEQDLQAVSTTDGESLWYAEASTIIHIRDGMETSYRLSDKKTFTINSITVTGLDSAFIATETGIFEISQGEVDKLELQGLPEALYCDEIVPGLMDGMYHIASREGLITYYRGRVSRVWTTENGLATNQIYDIYQEATGTIWLGTVKGAIAIFSSRFVYYTVQDGLASDDIQSIYEDNSGRIIIGDSSGSLTFFENGQFSTRNLKGPLATTSITDIIQDSSGQIYLGTMSGIAPYSDTEEPRLIDDSHALVCLYIDSRGRFWAGSFGAILRFENNKLRKAFPEKDLENISVMDIREDTRGRLWFATRSHGVYVLDGDELLNYDSDDGFTNKDVWTIHATEDGKVWLGTGGDGLFSFEDGEFSRFTEEDGLSNNTVWLMEILDDGTIWCGTNNGINKFDGETFTLYTIDDGLSENEGMNDCTLKDSQGRVWFGGAAGLNLLKQGHPDMPYVEPPIYLTDFEVNGEHRPVPQETARLASDQRFIVVFASIPNYRREGSVLYKYMLEGMDEDWNYTTKLNSFRYPNLSPGEYRFRIKTEYKGKESSNEASLSFAVAPPFYMTLWFPFLAVGLVTAVAFGWFRYRTAKINHDKVVLENKVRQRTGELQSANRELEAFNVALTNNLKVPVRHIIGFSEIARSPEHLEKRDYYLGRIHDNALNLTGMIGDLHDLANAGSTTLDKIQINLSLEARMQATKLKEENPEFRAQFEIKDDIYAVCDERLIRIVFKNLISNSFKATMHLDEGKIELGHEKQDDEIVYFIRDNGIGLDEKEQSLLFKPFTQIHHPEVFPGKGLGLIIVQRIINRHKGNVWVESKKGSGLTVYFTLPENGE
jgi:signal transduction histidine kinase/ligand-binding sensor domain-containing protein